VVHDGKSAMALRIVPLPEFVTTLLRSRRHGDEIPEWPLFAAAGRDGQPTYRWALRRPPQRPRGPGSGRPGLDDRTHLATHLRHRPRRRMSLTDRAEADLMGQAKFLEDTYVRRSERHPDAAVFLDAATLALYSDGLVERRTERLDHGLDRLARSAPSGSPRSRPRRWPRPSCATSSGTPAPEDDIALVVARLMPPPLAGRRPAAAAQLAHVRHAVEGWAQAAALRDDQLADLQFGMGEALANAVDHAYRDLPVGELRYRVSRLGDGSVAVEVSDAGRWRPVPADPGHRGRGLQMIDAVGRDADLSHDGTGTRIRFRIPPLVTDTLEAAADGLAPGGAPERAAPAVDDVVRLPIGGEVDLAAATALRAELVAGIESAPPASTIEIDLRATTYIASAGVALLVHMADLARSRGHRVVALVAPHNAAARVLALTGVDNVRSRRRARGPVERGGRTGSGREEAARLGSAPSSVYSKPWTHPVADHRLALPAGAPPAAAPASDSERVEDVAARRADVTEVVDRGVGGLGEPPRLAQPSKRRDGPLVARLGTCGERGLVTACFEQPVEFHRGQLVPGVGAGGKPVEVTTVGEQSDELCGRQLVPGVGARRQPSDVATLGEQPGQGTGGARVAAVRARSQRDHVATLDEQLGEAIARRGAEEVHRAAQLQNHVGSGGQRLQVTSFVEQLGEWDLGVDVAGLVAGGQAVEVTAPAEQPSHLLGNVQLTCGGPDAAHDPRGMFSALDEQARELPGGAPVAGVHPAPQPSLPPPSQHAASIGPSLVRGEQLIQEAADCRSPLRPTPQ
jgi:anti-anti-sigma factor